jgi:hypothetical protein
MAAIAPIDHHPHALDMFQQWRMSDGRQGLHIKAVRQGQLLQFGGDRFGTEGSQGAGQGQVHIGAIAVGALGAGAEQDGALDFRVLAQHREHQRQFAGL